MYNSYYNLNPVTSCTDDILMLSKRSRINGLNSPSRFITEVDNNMIYVDRLMNAVSAPPPILTWQVELQSHTVKLYYVLTNDL